MFRYVAIALLVMISCNDAEKAKLFDVIAAETCACSKQQTIAASAAISICIIRSAKTHDAELKRVGVDQESQAGLKQLQYEIAGRMERNCREIYIKALEERKGRR